MMSVVSAHVRHVLADHGHPVEVALPVVGAPHRLEDAARSGLERQVDVLAHARQLGVRAQHVLLHVLGVRARVADAVDALHRVGQREQLREGRLLALGQVAAVGVHVLAQQRHLGDAVGRQALELVVQLAGGPRRLAPARGGHDAVRAAAVAAHRDLHPGLELALAAGGQVPGEALELEVALRGERVAGQELGQPVDLARPEGDVHEREHLEHLVLQRLRPAAAHPDHPGRVLGLQPLGLAQVADQAAVGLLADRAGVEQDQVGAVAGRRLAVAERLEHALHALGVVLVHLAPEGGQVVALALHGEIEDSPGRGPISVVHRAPTFLPAPRERVFAALTRCRRARALVGARGLHDPGARLRPRVDGRRLPDRHAAPGGRAVPPHRHVPRGRCRRRGWH